FQDGKDKITVHVWGFGGQEMMHGTHRFFLTKRSLYLLVLNRRPGGIDKEADYWLSLIQASGGKGAPVIVVLNKQRNEPFDVNQTKWMEDYKDNIRGFIKTDCEDLDSIAGLRKKIEAELLSMPGVRDGFPNRYAAVKRKLSEMKAGFISLTEYRE